MIDKELKSSNLEDKDIIRIEKVANEAVNIMTYLYFRINNYVTRKS